MYEAFYDLKERPFDLTANPRFLFLTSGHREALGNLHYGITSHKGITLLLGEAGTGKTTIIRASLELQRRSASAIVYLSNPTLTRAEFFEFLANGFGLGDEAAISKVRFLDALQARLAASLKAGVISALVIDEAQSLPHDLLEEVRLLSNLETATEKLLPSAGALRETVRRRRATGGPAEHAFASLVGLELRPRRLHPRPSRASPGRATSTLLPPLMATSSGRTTVTPRASGPTWSSPPRTGADWHPRVSPWW